MKPVLSIHALDFVYPDGRRALKQISLEIKAGEKVALVGPNGAGKSTLLLQINGLLRGQGQISVGDLELNTKNLPQIRALVGLVFQNPEDQLFSPTVFEDVAFGPQHMGLSPQQVEQRVIWALDQVGMSAYRERLSHHLSIGEQKRIAVATVLAMQPAILVLDEPSAGLDPRGRRGLINLLRELPQTMLVSTHDLRMVQELFERMLIMDEGQIVADGPTADVLADAALLAAHGLEMP